MLSLPNLKEGIMIETKMKRHGMILHETEILEQEAKLASDFIVRWGCVAAVPDGEDKAGRPQLRLMTEDELGV